MEATSTSTACDNKVCLCKRLPKQIDITNMALGNGLQKDFASYMADSTNSEVISDFTKSRQSPEIQSNLILQFLSDFYSIKDAYVTPNKNTSSSINNVALINVNTIRKLASAHGYTDSINVGDQLTFDATSSTGAGSGTAEKSKKCPITITITITF